MKARPIKLALRTEEDQDRFDLLFKIDSDPKSTTFGKDFLTAPSVQLSSRTSHNEPDVVFNLKRLTVDHLRKLCTNIGIAN